MRNNNFSGILGSATAKLVALVLLFMLGAVTWFADVIDIMSAQNAVQDYRNLMWFTSATAISLAALIAAPFFVSRSLRFLVLGIFFFSIAVEVFSYRMFNDDLSVSMIKELLQAKDEVGFAIRAYGVTALAVVATLFAVFVPLFAEPRRQISRIFYVLPVAGFVLAHTYTSRNIDKLETLPANTALLSRAYLAWMSPPPTAGHTRKALSPEWLPASKGVETIIVIVDESIRGDFLQINGYPSDNTPFLAARSDLINFGTAVSYTNCSAGARMSLRSMVRENDFPDPDFSVLRQPTMWQYARRAGYKTIYLDGWQQIRAKHSFLTTDELTHVSVRTSVPLIPFNGADIRIARAAARIAKEPGPKFIFVEKIGLHQPYAMNYPPPGQRRRYAANPRLTSAQNNSVHDYIDGLHYSVDRFFEELLPALDMSRTAIIYTSDHGQALYEGGYSASHCSRETAVPGESLVPLFAFVPPGPQGDLLRRSTQRSFNAAAHSDIPGTLLRLFGYEDDLTVREFGSGLFDIPSGRKRRYFLGSPFIENMKWSIVDP